MSVLDDVIADLEAEGDQLRATVAALDADGWRTTTPAEGWDVATTVAHLLWTDEVAVLAAGALADDAGKQAWDAVVLTAIEDPTGFVDAEALRIGAASPDDLLTRWDAARPALVAALREHPDGQKLPWFGPPMSPTSMATARYMETWAHALDVYDAIGARPEVTDRIRHVAHIGVRTRNFAYANNGLEAPAEEFRVELTAPSGTLWTWGPEDAAQRVTGDAYEFCQLVTQRIHRDDTGLKAVGDDAEKWLTIAQAFAGPAGGGRDPPMTQPIKIANCSGFYGDRLSALREQLEGGDVDVITGDYLAELTMLILGMDTLRDADLGYARTFLKQLDDTLGLALDKGVKIVSNAGGLNPAALARKIDELGTGAKVAYVEGDDLRPADLFEGALTANAYLGAFGIASALSNGADVVVTGRVTDASVVVGPAIAHHGWAPTDYDALAGAVVAGHVIECGTQATGGNFSGFTDLFRAGAPMTKPLGFPIAEIAADGSSVITKHDGTGGAVTVDTVTAQLLYEIQSTRYLNPDVTTRLDSIRLHQQGPDRVEISGVTGAAPAEQLKVAVNTLGGYRNQVEFVLTGLDIDAKADWLRSQLDPQLTAQSVTWTQTPARTGDADTEEGASVILRCIGKDPEAGPLGKPFTGPAVELALASYPGFTMTTPPQKPSPFGIYRPEYVDRGAVEHTVVHHDGTREVIADPTEFADPAELDPDLGKRPSPYPAPADTITRRMPLGTFVHARSGDKGGNANLGLWVKNDGSERYEARVQWLAKIVKDRKIRELVPEAKDLDIDVYVLPNLGAVNVVIHGLLGDGVAASTRFDPQAKGLGEWVRSRIVHIQEDLV